MTADRLRCEYMSNPLGIDVSRPRLSWIVCSEAPAQRQSAYQILAASDKSLLQSGSADLWDSGKVSSDNTLHVPYEGRKLRSYQRVYWTVRVWDKQGNASGWAEPAYWTMGILEQDQWKGDWIEYHRPWPGARVDMSPADWIWYPDFEDPGRIERGVRYFVHTFDVPAQGIDQAVCYITADDKYQLYINGQAAGQGDSWRHIDQLDIGQLLGPGKNIIAVRAENTGDQPMNPAGLLALVDVQLEDGTGITVVSGDNWLSSDSPAPGWNQGRLDPDSWTRAQAVGSHGDGPWGSVAVQNPITGNWLQEAPSPVFRKAFELGKTPAQATLHISGLGYYEAWLNGSRVGDYVLDPAFTRYDRRVLYSTYDVTDILQEGANAIGVMLGNGWYNVHTEAAWNFNQAPWRDAPTLLAQLRVVYADGTVEYVVTDTSWKAGTGPVVLDGVRQGMVYDARLEMPGWDKPGFDDSEWQNADKADGPAGVLSAQNMPAIKITDELTPVSITEPKPGVFVVDIGQNIAGWVRMKVEGPEGTEVTLKYGERLNDDGTVDQREIAAHTRTEPFQTDVYILRGQGTEIWQPNFTYHGFQYVQIEGYPGTPKVDSFVGCMVNTAFEETARFECSNELFNKIQDAIIWSYRGNYHGYPTDCPHREKNGWTGDAHLAMEVGAYNFDAGAAYTKWIMDIKDEQRPSGEIPGIVPTGGWGYEWGNGPAWDSAYLIIPWEMYRYWGDQRILETHYDRFKLYVDYLTENSDDYIINFGLGDWAPANTETPHALTSTVYYYIDARITAKSAQILGHESDARHYHELTQRIARAFHEYFYRGDGIYDQGSQTALSVPLYYGMVPPDKRQIVLERLIENIESQNYHIDTGILGAKAIFNVLTEMGRHDIAYKMATRETFPSYGYWFEQGANTLWEFWQGNDSLNHIFFGDIGAWFFKNLAGIRVDSDPLKSRAFSDFTIKPMPVADLTWVDAEYDSIRGTIANAWRIDGDKFTMKTQIPANTTATLYLPAAQADAVKAASAQAVFIEYDNGYAVYRIGSGKHSFESRLSQ